MAIKTKKISELITLETLSNTDNILVSDASGLKKIQKSKTGFLSESDLTPTKQKIEQMETNLLQLATKTEVQSVDTKITTLESTVQNVNSSVTKLDKTVEAIQNQITDVHSDSWRVVQTNLGLGKRETLYPLGTQFLVHNDSINADLVMEVVNYPKDNTQDIILESVKCYYGYQVDNWEAMYIAKEQLEPGQYQIFMTKPYEENTSDRIMGGNQTYVFTLTQPVPVGGALFCNGSYGKPLNTYKIQSYSDRKKTKQIESVALTEGSGGIDLGKTDGLGELNQIDRFRFGNNNIKQSNLRQFMNATGKDWWTPQGKWDVAPSYDGKDGFLGGFPKDFQEAMAVSTLTVATCPIYEEAEFGQEKSYTIQDKLFLPSMTNLGYGENNGIAEGDIWDKYSGASNADRIKYDDGGTARYYWLYSPTPWFASLVRIVIPSGSLSNGFAYSGSGFAPACRIKAI